MRETAVIFSFEYLNHVTDFTHPESPRRLEAIMEGLNESAIFRSDRCSLIEPEPASFEALELVHDADYIRWVDKICKSGGGLLNVDGTVVSRGSFKVAVLAVGGAIKAVKSVMRGEFKNSFAIVRPPGHHAGPHQALGFCIFNNAALAATYLLRSFNLKRVLILDIDAHHGNGTQEIFYDTDEVLYVSLHEDPSGFPETGFIDEVGEGRGLGYTVNIPLPFGAGDPAYWRAFKDIVIPVIQQYEPQFIMVSTGFDGYYRDPVANLSLSTSIYLTVFQSLLCLAHRLCSDRLVAILEGGYKPSFLREIMPGIISKMAGLKYKVRVRRPPLDLEAEKASKKIIGEIKHFQSSFWDL